MRRLIPIALLLCASAAAILRSPGALAGADQTPSRAAADSCHSKLKDMEAFASAPNSGKEKVTRLSQEEVNSYLALDLSKNYNPSVKSLQFAFPGSGLLCSAVLDFDQLAANSKRLSTRLFTGMFSGIHNLSVRGNLITDTGKARFQLDQAQFDSSTLPNFLVEEIITAAGRKQRPPFDPMQPSQMPYRIQKVEFQKGYVVVHQ